MSDDELEDSYTNKLFIIENDQYDINKSIYKQKNIETTTVLNLTLNIERELFTFKEIRFYGVGGFSIEYSKEEIYSRNYLVKKNVDDSFFSYNAIDDLEKYKTTDFSYFFRFGMGFNSKKYFSRFSYFVELPFIVLIIINIEFLKME